MENNPKINEKEDMKDERFKKIDTIVFMFLILILGIGIGCFLETLYYENLIYNYMSYECNIYVNKAYGKMLNETIQLNGSDINFSKAKELYIEPRNKTKSFVCDESIIEKPCYEQRMEFILGDYLKNNT